MLFPVTIFVLLMKQNKFELSTEINSFKTSSSKNDEHKTQDHECFKKQSSADRFVGNSNRYDIKKIKVE